MGQQQTFEENSADSNSCLDVRGSQNETQFVPPIQESKKTAQIDLKEVHEIAANQNKNEEKTHLTVRYLKKGGIAWFGQSRYLSSTTDKH